jgi:VIT1/CCC1 family predicted Fe2+/Mn2+ transporter
MEDSMRQNISAETMRLILKYQKAEITDCLVYKNLAKRTKDKKESDIIMRLSREEQGHYNVLKKYTKQDIGPNRWILFWYSLLSILLGYTFIIKIQERKEDKIGQSIIVLADQVPEAAKIVEEEQVHEDLLIEMLNEERLQYIGSMVLGLNDALVELTGAMAGLTIATRNTKLVAVSGIITGISATLSMAASNYLATRAEGGDDAVKSSIYTGAAYLVAVIIMVLPYLLVPTQMYITAFVIMILSVILIILFFNYFVSVVKSVPFGSRFLEMLFITLGVALISFVIGILANSFLGIDA